jgi:Fe-S oxidoreductase
VVLEDYRSDMETCCRCSICKFIPLEKLEDNRYSYVCPSVARYNFHAYAASGRMAIGTALLDKRLEYSSKLMDVVYNCQMCGACDVSCKYAMDMEVLDPINEVRIKTVEDGYTLPTLDKVIRNMQEKNTMVPGSKVRRGEWASSLKVKNATMKPSKLVFHAGCRTCFDKNRWQAAQDSVNLLQKAEVDVGILGEQEICCGGRAYQMGYKAAFLNQARSFVDLMQKTGAETLVTSCADCYYSFKVLNDKFGLQGKLKILHITEYLARIIKEGKLKPSKPINLKVTYHDPCHLGRLSEPYIHWEGKLAPGHIRIFDPPKEFRRGTYGVYEAPRDILKSIPGIRLIEMKRIKEYAWCCGAGGGVKETNPDFAGWAAKERITEAESTGAEALVTACPGCESNFTDTLQGEKGTLKVFDVVELLKQAIS